MDVSELLGDGTDGAEGGRGVLVLSGPEVPGTRDLLPSTERAHCVCHDGTIVSC